MTNINKTDWAKSLKPGDKVLSSYITDLELTAVFLGLSSHPKEREVTVEYVVENTCSESGVMVKLKEFARQLDIFWIDPCDGQG